MRKQPPWWPDGSPATHLKALVGWKQVARHYAVAHKAISGSTALLDALGPDGLLCLTADHGNDPTYLASTDHTREYVPLMFASRRFGHGADLGTTSSFATLGQTLAANFAVAPLAIGDNLLPQLTTP